MDFVPWVYPKVPVLCELLVSTRTLSTAQGEQGQDELPGEGVFHL